MRLFSAFRHYMVNIFFYSLDNHSSVYNHDASKGRNTSSYSIALLRKLKTYELQLRPSFVEFVPQYAINGKSEDFCFILLGLATILFIINCSLAGFFIFS